MLTIHATAVLGFACLLACAPSKAPEIASVRGALAKIERYSGHVQAVTTMVGKETMRMMVETNVAVVTPDRMRVDATMTSSARPGEGMRMVAVYEPSGLRSFVASGEVAKKLHVGAAARKDPMRPFDLAYGISGIGFGPNTDLVGTLNDLTTAFHFEPGRREKRDDRDVVVFAGTMSFDEAVAKFLEHAEVPEPCAKDDSTCPIMRDGLVKMLDKQRRIELLADPQTMLPVGYDVPMDESSMVVRFSDMRWNGDVADTALAWNEGETEDITAAVLEQAPPPARKPQQEEVARAVKALRP